MRPRPAARPRRALVLVFATLLLIALCPLLRTPGSAEAGDRDGGGIAGGDAGKKGGGDGGDGDPPPVEPQPRLFSVDREANTLTAIDPTTGAIEVVGPIGRSVPYADLAWIDDRLFANVSDHATYSDLVELDPQTGEMISSVAILVDGEPVPVAEGLGSMNGKLYLGFSSGGGLYYSNAIGELALDGSLQNVIDLSTVDGEADLDAMCPDPAGRLLSSDTQPSSSLIRTFDLTESATQYVHIGDIQISGAIETVNDIAFLDGVLYGIDSATASLHVIDPANGSRVTSLPLTGAGDLFGLVGGMWGGGGGDPILGDVNGDGAVDVADLIAVILAWGPCPGQPCPADLDGNEVVDVQDLVVVVLNWG